MSFKSAKAFHEDYTSRLLKLGYTGVTVRPQTWEYHKKIILTGVGKVESFVYLKDDTLAATFPIGYSARDNNKNAMAILHYLITYARFKRISEIRLREVADLNGWSPKACHWDNRDANRSAAYITALGFTRKNPKSLNDDLISPTISINDSFNILETVHLHLSNRTKDDATFFFFEKEVTYRRDDAFFSFYVKHLGLAIQFHVITTEGKYYLLKNNDIAFEFTEENFAIQFDDLINKEHDSNQLKILVNPPIDNLADLLVRKRSGSAVNVKEVAETIMHQFIEKEFAFDEVEREAARILNDNSKEEIILFNAPFAHGSYYFFGKYHVAYSFDNLTDTTNVIVTESTDDIQIFYKEQFEKSLRGIFVAE